MVTWWLDKLACYLGMWALTRLYGTKCRDFDGECACCRANAFIDDMREIIAEGR